MGSSSDRLPSFKGPRDLSLASRGGNTASGKPNVSAASSDAQPRPRRVFTPNIPPKRDRGSVPQAGPSTAAQQSEQSGPAPGSSRGKSPRGRGGTRGGSRTAKQKPELMQSDSIFSDGVGDPLQAKRSAATQYKTTYGGGRYKSAEGGSSRISSLNRSTLNTFIKQEDDESSKKIFGAEAVEPEEEEDTNPENPNVPVVLPLSSYIPDLFSEPTTLSNLESNNSQPPAVLGSNLATDMVPVVKIKEEKIDDDDTTLVKIKQEMQEEDERTQSSQRMLEMMPLEPTSFAGTLRSTPPDGTLVYFQFPDELPVLESSVREPADQGSSKTSTQLVRDIDDLPEGVIGRLQILSSGRARFIIGENSFDVDPGRPVGFRQELFSIDTDSGILSNLGTVNRKFVLTPDIQYLLRDAV